MANAIDSIVANGEVVTKTTLDNQGIKILLRLVEAKLKLYTRKSSNRYKRFEFSDLVKLMSEEWQEKYDPKLDKTREWLEQQMKRHNSFL